MRKFSLSDDRARRARSPRKRLTRPPIYLYGDIYAPELQILHVYPLDGTGRLFHRIVLSSVRSPLLLRRISHDSYPLSPLLYIHREIFSFFSLYRSCRQYFMQYVSLCTQFALYQIRTFFSLQIFDSSLNRIEIKLRFIVSFISFSFLNLGQN